MRIAVILALLVCLILAYSKYQDKVKEVDV